jgi:ABC-2 type transport system permease protein
LNVYLHETRTNLTSMLYWTAGMLLGLLFFMFMFPAITRDVGAIDQITSQFPPEVIRALGLSTLDLSTVLGFYSYVFLFIVLVGSIYALKLGINSLAQEIEAKTADFLLSKPMRRTAIVTAKGSSSVTMLLLQNLIYIPIAYVIVKLTTGQPFDHRSFLLINLALLFTQLFFVALGMLLAVIIKRVKNVLTISLGTVFGFWILQTLNQTLADPTLSYLTPFAYFDFSQIISNRGFNNTYLLTDLALVIIFTVLAYWIYQRQDMPSV